MSFQKESDMHRKRKSQNIGVAVCLVAFIVLLVALSLTKLRSTGAVEGFDHAVRPSVTEDSE
ncbi:MAG: cytochrome C oxidase assembly protein [Planktomarina sp.]